MSAPTPASQATKPSTNSPKPPQTTPPLPATPPTHSHSPAPTVKAVAAVPEQLQYAMEAQLQRESFTKRNNEMVVDLTSVAPRLPRAVEGFFYVAGSADYKEAEARDAYAAFKEFYGLDTLVAPPLMVIDMMEDHAPFALDASLAEVAETIPYGYGPKPKKNGKKSG